MHAGYLERCHFDKIIPAHFE